MIFFSINSKSLINWPGFFLISFISFSTHGSAAADVENPGYKTLYRRISYTFKDPKLLELALTHHSFDIGTTMSARGNERLEFLGDAVLDYVMKLQVLERSYGAQLADLNKNTASFTENSVLVRIADAIDLAAVAMLPSLPTVAATARKLTPLEDAKADLVESLMGAMYLDSGNLVPIEGLIRRFWFSVESPQNYAETVLKPSPAEEEATVKLGYQFRTPWYLSASLGQSLPMESIGKSVLKFVVNEFLYRRFPEFPEGELAKRSSVLHTKKNITALNLSDSNAALALIGGIHMDGGLNAARKFILWHWTGSKAPIEIREAVRKAPNTVASGSPVVYPMGIKDLPPKTLLLEVLKPLAKVASFETKEVSLPPASKFTSKVVLDDATVISREASAATKKDAEKEAALDALEGLGVKALVDINTPPGEGILVSHIMVLEGFLKAKGINFNYHQLAEHPSGKGFSIEIQGKDLVPIIADGPTRTVAQYRALVYSLLQFLEDEFISYTKTPPEHRLELNSWLRFYKRYASESLRKLAHGFEVNPVAKTKEKITPLLTYQINVPFLALITDGTGYSAEEAELNALIRALKDIELRAPLAGVAGELGAAACGAGARA